MKRFLVASLVVLLLPTLLTGQSKKWVSAYYAGWMQSYLPPSAIDFGAVTHIMHFSLTPSGGGVSGTGNGITANAAQAIVTAAHAAGKKVIITIGGAGDNGAFVTSTNTSNRATFVASLVNFAVTNGYDGIDIDWEPINNAAQYKLFIPELRAAMDAAKAGMTLTTAIVGGSGEYATVNAVKDNLDQINIMTYDMSGAWQGWVTWHNSPVYDGGMRFPSTNGLVPSANGEVNGAIAAGIPKEKLGIGTDFYGYVWTGVSQPRQTWTTAPSVADNIPYSQLMTTYAGSPILWDTLAAAAYMSVTTGSGKFVSLDNEQTMFAKAQYIRDKGIGGLIIWELGGGYRPSQPVGQRDKLLQAIKQAFTVADAPAATVPAAFELQQNFPNPFNPSTTIGFTVAATKTGSGSTSIDNSPLTMDDRSGSGSSGLGSSFVTLKVYDMLGREVATLVNDQRSPGTYRVSFDGTGLASGIYIYRLTANGAAAARSMILLK